MEYDMIDTISFSGSSLFLNKALALPKVTYEAQTKNRHKIGGLQKILSQAWESNSHRIFVNNQYNRARIELNIGKLLFADNIENYLSPSFCTVGVSSLVTHLARCFFPIGEVYLSRIDLGHTLRFDTALDADNVLETYRNTKPPTIRATKFRHQNYANSVFYFSRPYSIKIYNKGRELKDKKHYNVLRFEITMRPTCLQNRGYRKIPYLGVPIFDGQHFSNGFQSDAAVSWYLKKFDDWERAIKPAQTNLTGIYALYDILNNVGELENARAMGHIPSSTYYNYKSKVKNREKNFICENTKWETNEKRQQHVFHLINSPFIETLKYFSATYDRMKK